MATSEITNAPGGMTTLQGGQATMMPPDFGAPTPEAPQQPPQPEAVAPSTPKLQLEEPVKSPTVVSTDSMRDQLNLAEQQLKDIQAQVDAGKVAQQATPTEVPTVAPKDKPEVDDGTGFIDAYTAETAKLLKEREQSFNKYLTRSDNLLKSQVNSLQQTFDQRRQQAEEVANNAKAATRVLGSRTGRLRYAPEIQRGIITGQENALLETLTEIDAQEAAAMAAAESAAFDRDYETFIDQMDSLDVIQKTRQATLSELQATMDEENERRREEAETLKQESLIIEQFAAGITDPIEVYQTLEGQVPYDMVVEYTNTLPEGYGQPVVVGGAQVAPMSGGGVLVDGQAVPDVDGLTKETATTYDVESLPISAGAKPWVRMWLKGEMSVDDILSTMGTSNAAQALKNEVIGVISQMDKPTGPQEKTEMDIYIEEQAKTAKTNIEDIMRLMNIEKQPNGSWISGPMLGSEATPVSRIIGQFFPGTDAKDIRTKLDTIQALIGFDALADMPAASPTGGALGQVTEKELNFLQSVRGSLDVGQSTDEFIRQLKRVYDSFSTLDSLAAEGGVVEQPNKTTNANLLGVGSKTEAGGVPDVLEGL